MMLPGRESSNFEASRNDTGRAPEWSLTARVGSERHPPTEIHSSGAGGGFSGSSGRSEGALAVDSVNRTDWDSYWETKD